MKRIFIAMLAFVLLFTGCTPRMRFFLEDDDEIADETFDRVVTAISERDSSKLEKVFSKTVRENTTSLENNILNFFDFFDGDIVFADTVKHGVGSEGKIENGRTRKLIQSAFDLNTTKHKYYIAMMECVKDDFDKRNIGVKSIYVIKADDWNQSHVYRGDGEWTLGINIDQPKQTGDDSVSGG